MCHLYLEQRLERSAVRLQRIAGLGCSVIAFLYTVCWSVGLGRLAEGGEEGAAAGHLRCCVPKASDAATASNLPLDLLATIGALRWDG